MASVAEAHALYRETKFSAAIKAYTTLLGDNANNPDLRSSRARCYLHLKMWNKTLKESEDILEAFPAHAGALECKAAALYALDRAAEADALCERVMSTSFDAEVALSFHKLRAARQHQPAAVAGQPQPNTSPAPAPAPAPAPPTPTQTSAAQAAPAPKPSRSSSAATEAARLAKALQENDVSQLVAKANISNRVGDLDVDKQIALGYFKTNNGLHGEAIEHFSEMLRKDPTLIAALLGRGTSLALLGQLAAAEKDFTAAIVLDQKLVDAYKRRSQVLAAQGKQTEALQDLNAAVQFGGDSDSFIQRAALFQKLGFLSHAKEDAEKACTLEPTNKNSWNSCGLILNALGDCLDAVARYDRAIALDRDYKEAWCNKGQAYRDWGMGKESLEAFTMALKIDRDYTAALHLRGFAHFGLGNFPPCIRDVTRVIEMEPKHKDGLTLKALAFHNMGQFRKAVEVYDTFLRYFPNDPVFYNRENCLLLHHNLHKEVKTLNWDRFVNSYFKEAWCKRTPPSELKKVPKQPQLDPKIPDVVIEKGTPFAEALAGICKVADIIGPRLQLKTQGFLENLRQHRMCGLAVLEMAQQVQRHWAGTLPPVPGSYSSMQTEPHEFGWRDLFDIVVRWRQLSEANDPVWWIDVLPEDLYSEGFGLQTPMVTGQLKVPRYYPYFQRCFDATKRLIENQHVLTDEMAEKVAAATDCRSLHDAMKRDFFVISPCLKLELEPEDEVDSSISREPMEGTRFTLLSVPADHGYQFTIRTPGIPYRYKDYYVEMDILWKRITREARKPEHDVDKLSDLISIFYFYWVNFQPLTRGSAACGMMALMALFLAAGIEMDSIVEEGVQTDWEGIITPHWKDFLATVKPWLYPRRRPSTLLQSVPDVSDTLRTFHHHLQALNYGLC
eukprot:TRINITY_DN56241_c0_g1_i1.p1 TRINITY_DN56241_c0_g1~~TRINITY_DN56241_c0_g1_i1.p1  ORF type:complete len:907 (+),score=159.92 TRINITY_DN56241_c0_g1_i1:30-2723(+)